MSKAYKIKGICIPAGLQRTYEMASANEPCHSDRLLTRYKARIKSKKSKGLGLANRLISDLTTTYLLERACQIFIQTGDYEKACQAEKGETKKVKEKARTRAIEKLIALDIIEEADCDE